MPSSARWYRLTAVKIGTLRAIAHNIADSLGSGIGLLIGVYEMDVFAEAVRSPNGVMVVDFLAGKVTTGVASPHLADALAKYRKALPELCEKHGASLEDFRELSARYSLDAFSRRIAVTVEDRNSRRVEDAYVGTPARHLKVIDQLGRIRTQRRAILKPKREPRGG